MHRRTLIYKIWTATVVGVCLVLALPLIAFAQPNIESLPMGTDYFELRNGLSNCRLRFEQAKKGRIAFLGGSITASNGWRNHTMEYFKRRFPKTDFDFVGAGIGSLGSVPHAFRLERDLLANGPIDLLFVEAAVNDTSNTSNPDHMLRGMEGVVRQMRMLNPLIDVVHLHFVMPNHMDDYKNGRVPVSIEQHERVAQAYGNVSINLAKEVTDRIQAGQFQWDRDFQGLHPSPFGHRLYASSIERMAESAFADLTMRDRIPHSLPPQPLDSQSYFRGRFGDIQGAKIIRGFALEKKWHPTDQKPARTGFVDVPALVGSEAGAEFEYSFSGKGIGLFITSGPDAGQIECSVDGGPYRTHETFTRWSSGLHLPWAVILDDQLEQGRHVVRVRIGNHHHANGKGTAVRVFQFLLN